MTITNSFLKNTILPFNDLFLGYTISKDLKYLMESQWWTREQIDEFQNYNLRKLIKHSYENVPFYNEQFKKLKLTPDDIKTKDDLYKLPILRKEEIRKNFPKKITAKNLSRLKFIHNASSGSTGQPLNFYETKRSASFHKAAAIRAWYWMGYNLGDKYVKISTNVRKSIIKRTQDFFNRCDYIYFQKITDKVVSNIIKEIESFNPIVVRGYPFLLYCVAEEIEKRGVTKLNNLKAINTTSSTLHEFMRDKIERIFKTNIFDSYSCEGSAFFAQCESGENYHPSEESAIAEFIEDDFTKNDPDGAKRHITTNLLNYAMPFIRYDTQDYVVVNHNKRCSCGRNFLNISKIKGRDNSILILPNGNYLIDMDFFQYFDDSVAVDQFQVIQEKRDLIRIKLVVNNFFNNKIMNKITDYWNKYLGENVNLFVEVVNNIELSPSGKRRFLIRNQDIKIPV